MKKLFLKSLRESKRSLTGIVSCGVFVIFVIALTTSIADSLYQITEGTTPSATQVYMQLGIFKLTYVILGALMVLMTLTYIRKRSYEYAMFDALGMKKKHKYGFVACEYAVIIIASFVGGISLGLIGGRLFLPILGGLLTDGAGSAGEVAYTSVPLRLTLIFGTVIFILVFIVCDEMIACLGMDAALSMGRRSGRVYRFSPIMLGIGSVISLTSFVILFSYWGKVNKMIPAALLSVGLLLLMTSFTAAWLGKVRKNVDYYSKVLWLEQWYHRFHYNVNLSVIVAIFIFMNVFSFGVKMCDNLPTVSKTDYPHAFVWMANDSDTQFLQKIRADYGIRIQTVPCVRVTTPDFGEHMGIGESEYQAWTKKPIKLSGKEIHVVYQRNREERNMLGIDYGYRRPRLYIGNAYKGLWQKTMAGWVLTNAFKRGYTLKGTENLTLTGMYHSRALSDMRSEVWEQVIVFSDEYFQEIKGNAEGANLAVLIDTPKKMSEEQYGKLREEIYSYAAEHSQRNYLDYKDGNLIYERKTEFPQNQQRQLLRLTAAGVNIFILLVCSIFILWIKGNSDYDDLRWKYLFYRQSGMEGKKRKRCMKKEMFLAVKIALLGGVPSALVMLAADVSEKDLGVQMNLRYLIEIIGITGVLIVVIIGMSAVFTRRIIRRIEKE